MDEFLLERMTVALKAIETENPSGVVSSANGGFVQVEGLPDTTQLGDRVMISANSKAVSGEVIGCHRDRVDVLMDGFVSGLSVGTIVRLQKPPVFAPHQGWIGRVIDPDGMPLDGRPLLPGPEPRPVVAEVLPANDRRPLGARMETGIAAMNTLLPIVAGQRIGLFAGSGVGKSTLLAKLAKGISADVIVIALVGERGREVREFTAQTLGDEGMKRAVVVAATSDRSPNIRRRCAWAATAVAEHFRDQGLQVLLLCDSVTRFCEAHREVAVASGENANLRGFPPSTSGIVASLCERAGPILDGHIVLDRKIAERGRFPAIDVLRSVSRSLPGAANAIENDLISLARKRMSAYDKSEMMIKAGLYEAGSDKDLDAAVACNDLLERFLEITDGRPSSGHFASLKQCLD